MIPATQGWAQTRNAAPKVEISVINKDGRVTTFTDADFAALPRHAFTTHTAWHDPPQHFEGVLMRDLLAAAGYDHAALEGREMLADALNGYSIPFAGEEPFRYDILIARTMNGVPLTRRDKGPFWIVFPRDDVPELDDASIDHRWVWQLRSLTIE